MTASSTTQPTTAAIALRGVSKQFGKVSALNKVDLCFPESSTTALIGPSGCGKSTLLRLIVGLSAPDAGVVEFEGAKLNEATLQSARQRMGYVIQEGGLFPHLTARQNVTLAAEHFGWNATRCAKRVGELAELVHLTEAMLARYPAQLSGGQRQRVSLMRALMLDPDVLLLDEPLGALDPLVRAELQDELRDIFVRLGKTVVLVTHDLAEAVHLAQRIVLMYRGEIVQIGSLADLQQQPESPFVTDFVRAQRRVLGADEGDAS